jgi:hypothetical protein
VKIPIINNPKELRKPAILRPVRSLEGGGKIKVFKTAPIHTNKSPNRIPKIINFVENIVSSNPCNEFAPVYAG